MLYVDIPTRPEFKALNDVRAAPFERPAQVCLTMPRIDLEGALFEFDGRHLQSAAVAALLLCFKPALRLEWRGQGGQDEAEQCKHCALKLGDSFS